MNRRKFLRNTAGLFVPAAFGLPILRASAQVFGGNAAVGGNVALGNSGSGVASNSYLISEDFEGAGTPTNWTNEGGTVDFHNTATPIEGSKDLKLTGASSAVYAAYAAQSEVWCVLKVKWPSTFPGSNWIQICDAAGATTLAKYTIASNGSVDLYTGTPTLIKNLGTIDNNVWYVWFHYKASTIIEGEISTTGNWVGSGSNYGTTSSGVSATQTQSLELLSFVGSSVCQFDHVRVATQNYGNFSLWT